MNFDCKNLLEGFDSWLCVVAFCPSVFKFSFRFCFFPFVGALHVEVDFGDLEADFDFCSALLMKVDFVDLEANLIFTVLFL